jgi:hypothetical protein
LFAHGIFKVIYSPLKAFEEIIQNPKYTGPILIMILFVFANTGFGYVFLSKSYIDQTMPPLSGLDEWTENCTLWLSSVGVPKCSGDHVSSVCYGNRSMDFTVVNDSQMWMRLNIPDSVSCSGLDGFRALSVRVKRIITGEVEPNVTISLFSASSDYFFLDLTENFTGLDDNYWNNLTIPLGSESERWKSVGANVSWDNVNGLELFFAWPSVSNMTVLVDGLFFHGVFKPAIEVLSGYLFDYPVTAFMQFMVRWVILGGLLFIFSKAFGVNATWKVLLMVAGFTFITVFIQAVIRTGAFAVSPDIYYPLEALIGGEEGEAALVRSLEPNQFLFQFVYYVEIAVGIWTSALCVVAVYLLSEFSWTKSLLVAALSCIVYFLIVTGEIVRLITPLGL